MYYTILADERKPPQSSSYLLFERTLRTCMVARGVLVTQIHGHAIMIYFTHGAPGFDNVLSNPEIVDTSILAMTQRS